MKYDVLYNFISPVTGRIKVDQGYIIVGDKENIGMPSPILIDIRQDIIDLRRKLGGFEELNKLDHNRIWIGDYNNEPVEQLHIGVINLPPLAEALFPNPISPITGDFRIPNPTFDYLSPFDWVMSGPFLPQIYATKYDALGNPVGTDVSSSLAMTQIRAAQIMKRFDNANFIVGSSTVEFVWENPKMYLIPEELKQLYGLGTTYTFTKAQSLGALETGLLKNTVNNGTGTLSKAIAGKDYIDVAAPIPNMKLALIRPVQQDAEGNDIAKLLARVDRLPEENMANLTFIMQRPNPNIPNAQGLSDIAGLLGGILKCNSSGVVSLASGGVTPLVDDYVTPANLAEEKTERIGADSAIETALVAFEAEMEAQIAALAGVQALSALATILAFMGITAGGTAYGDYIRGQLLNVKNSFDSSDLNDEGHIAVGDFEFRYPSGYTTDNRGKGGLWFDSYGRNPNLPSAASSSGLRLFAWDSGGDHLGYDSPLAPLHIGIFGYQNRYNIAPIPNPTPIYKGFIFESDFNNDKNSVDYRFPVKFGLYDVKRTISTFFTQRWGWDSKETIFEYDYHSFNFSKPVKILDKTAIKISTGGTLERPVNGEQGMVRYNIDI